MEAAIKPEVLAALTVEERLQLIEAIWESLRRSQQPLPTPQWQLDLVRERVAEFRRNPNLGTDAFEFLRTLGRGE